MRRRSCPGGLGRPASPPGAPGMHGSGVRGSRRPKSPRASEGRVTPRGGRSRRRRCPSGRGWPARPRGAPEFHRRGARGQEGEKYRSTTDAISKNSSVVERTISGFLRGCPAGVGAHRRSCPPCIPGAAGSRRPAGPARSPTPGTTAFPPGQLPPILVRRPGPGSRGGRRASDHDTDVLVSPASHPHSERKTTPSPPNNENLPLAPVLLLKQRCEGVPSGDARRPPSRPAPGRWALLFAGCEVRVRAPLHRLEQPLPAAPDPDGGGLLRLLRGGRHP